MIRGACVALCCLAASAAAAPDDYLSRLPLLVQKRLDEMTASRVPRPVPPTPITVTWKAMRVGSIDLGAPLVAFTAADLDRDGKSELYAVTSREVIAVALKNGKPAELGRVAFAGDRAVPSPRDVVGTAAVENDELVASSSAFASSLRVTLAGGKLAAQPGGNGGFLVCPNERWQLVPGRNYFAGDFHGVRCRGDLVDRAGTPLEVRGQLALEGRLVVEVKCATCTPRTQEYRNAGTAFEIADVDRNGTPEVIVSGFVAPGDPDVVKVHAIGSDEKKALFTKKFNGGVVGIAVANGTVIVAVRLAGATRVDLWRLN